MMALFFGVTAEHMTCDAHIMSLTLSAAAVLACYHCVCHQAADLLVMLCSWEGNSKLWEKFGLLPTT